MVRLLLGKREWNRYLNPSGELVDERGWPLDPGLRKRLRSAGFDPKLPVQCDLVEGTTTLRFRQDPNA